MPGESLHEAFWLLRNLHHELSSPDEFVNIRCIHNKQPYTNQQTGRTHKDTEVVFDTFVKIKEFKLKWESELLLKLMELNSSIVKPANIYYSVNPLAFPGHEKKHFAGFVAFYLDLDDNKSYTKEQRWGQIWYWSQLGYAPTFVADSGHGYHAYWVLTRRISQADGEPILRRMVALSGCRDKGNTWDISRVLRLPGFMNVKEWYNGNTPPCGLVLPENWQSLIVGQRYDPDYFIDFPPSEVVELNRYYNEAAKLSGNPDELRANVAKIMDGVKQAQRNLAASQAGQQIFAHAQSTNPAAAASAAVATPLGKSFEPTLRTVPALAEIKWPKGMKWMATYASKGYEGLTQGDLDELRVKYNLQDISASELDFKIAYALVRLGYQKEAVREFWTRAECRLYREDKEHKNPNYFDMTFDKALEWVRAAVAQKNPLSGPPSDEIMVHLNKTFFQNGDNIECILTADMKIEEIYVDQDASLPHEREWYKITATCTPGGNGSEPIVYNHLIPNTAFSGIPQFKQYTNDLLRIPTNNGAHLQRLISHLLSNRDIPKKIFHSKIVYNNGRYVFPQVVISKESIDARKDIPPDIQKRFPLFLHFVHEQMPIQQAIERLKTYWLDVLQMHLPQVVSGVLGAITAAALRPRLEESNTYSFAVPTLSIRGASTTAKTETVKYLMSITGMARDRICLSAKTSAFAFSRLLSATNCLPLVVDEFKETDMEIKQVDIVRELARRIYSGERMVRGRADLSVEEIHLKGNFIVIGESALERIGDTSEITRSIPLQTDDYQPALHQDRWFKIQEVLWHCLAPHFYQFLLHQDLTQLKLERRDLEKTLAPRFVSAFSETNNIRVAPNISSLLLGCRVFDKFIRSLDPSLPTLQEVCQPEETISQAICDWSSAHGHAGIMTTTTGTKVTVATNELFLMIQTYGEMIANRDPVISEMRQRQAFIFEAREHDNELCLNTTNMYNAFIAYKNRQNARTNHAQHKYTTIIIAALKRNEEWIKKHNVPHRAKNIVTKVIVLDLKIMRELNYWPSADMMKQTSDFSHEEMENLTENTPPGGKNRITDQLGLSN